MLLYLMRHGIAIDRADPDCPAERDRFLTREGLKRTREAARGLRKLEIRPTLYVSSPYVRALQTAEIVAQALGHSAKGIVTSDALLPSKNPTELLRYLARRKENQIICFGHAPNLDEVVARLLGLKGIHTELKKSGAAAFELKSILSPRAQLLWLMPVRALRHLN
jgi:phosphohistidine phosphatase